MFVRNNQDVTEARFSYNTRESVHVFDTHKLCSSFAQIIMQMDGMDHPIPDFNSFIDAKLVKEQTGTSLFQAYRALYQSEGDIVNAILLLTGNS